jgi:hypothetical protein
MEIDKLREKVYYFICLPFRFIKKHSEVFEVLLTALAILIAVVLYYETKKQVEVSQDALEYQRSADSSSSAYQWKKDSASLALTDSSNKMTRQSLRLTQRGIEVAENNAKLSEEYNRIRLRPYPFLTASCLDREDCQVVYIKLKNFGQTPMKDIVGTVSFEHSAGAVGRDFYSRIEIPNIVLGGNECLIDSFIVPWQYPIPEDWTKTHFVAVYIEYSFGYFDIWGNKHSKNDGIRFYKNTLRM